MSSAMTLTNINGKEEKIQMMQSMETLQQQSFQQVLLNLVQLLLQL